MGSTSAMPIHCHECGCPIIGQYVSVDGIIYCIGCLQAKYPPPPVEEVPCPHCGKKPSDPVSLYPFVPPIVNVVPAECVGCEWIGKPLLITPDLHPCNNCTKRDTGSFTWTAGDPTVRLDEK